jgi:transcriptional regulator with XRE-family HTH domain
MHLVYQELASQHASSYQKRAILTRPYTLAYLFRKLRINHTLNKSALADKCCVSEAYVSAVEDGSMFPSVGFCLCCAREFGANPEWVKRMWFREIMARLERRLRKRLEIEE